MKIQLPQNIHLEAFIVTVLRGSIINAELQQKTPKNELNLSHNIKCNPRG